LCVIGSAKDKTLNVLMAANNSESNQAGNRLISQINKYTFSFTSVLMVVFAVLLAASFFFTSTISFNGLLAVRIIMALLLAAIIGCQFIFTQTNKKNIQGRINYNKILFETNPDALIVYDTDTKEIIDFNKSAAALFEIADEAGLKGLYLSQLMMRYLTANSVNLELLMNNIPDNWKGQANFTTNKKNVFTGLIRNFTYIKGIKQYQVLSIMDISAIEKPEHTIKTSSDNFNNSSTKTKTRFLSSISHELRTPLNGIIGTANLILAEKNIPENIKTMLNQQLYSSEHMLCIINDILDFSKIESGKMELSRQSFNLLDALNYLVKSFENQFTKSKIGLVFNYAPELADMHIISDVVKLRQVLYNLLSNALKFTLEGSVVLDVVIEKNDTGSAAITFKVTDTGIGIKKEKQLEIFEGFAQVHDDNLKRRFGGTGLGLTISEKLVNLFGGKIKVESDLGKGASFYFTATFDKDLQLAKHLIKEETYVQPVDIRGVRVLVVEDNEVNVTILERFLQKWGIRIKEATNGIHALELLKFHKFDLILMDLEMPEMNGYDAVKIIRQKDTSIPIIAFTATLLDNMDSLITNDGFDDYILKPFRPADLKSKIEKFAPNRKIEYA
jgi:signal transduction histidine kinase/CheY-like chemotaxis protein